jgi:hypothetical protein
MKYLKMLGLAAVAAMAVMAFVGASSASATVICKTEVTEGCAASGWAYPLGTEGTASLKAGTTAVLETLGGSVLITCTESTVKSTLVKSGATTTVESGVSTLTFAKCTNPVVVLKPGSAELHWIAGTDNGTLTTKGTEVTVNVAPFGSCIYGTGPSLDAGVTEGGNPGKMKLSVVVPKVGGSFACPAEARVTAEYTATSPTNAWVAGS